MASDAALLALIVDDRQALAVLAAWAAIGPRLDQIADEETITALTRLASVSTHATKGILSRLHLIRVLIDGGISDLADKLLQSCVQNAISGKKTKR